MNYFSILPIENYITRRLSYEEAIRVCNQNMYEKNYYRDVTGS